MTTIKSITKSPLALLWQTRSSNGTDLKICKRSIEGSDLQPSLSGAVAGAEVELPAHLGAISASSSQMQLR